MQGSAVLGEGKSDGGDREEAHLQDVALVVDDLQVGHQPQQLLRDSPQPKEQGRLMLRLPAGGQQKRGAQHYWPRHMQAAQLLGAAEECGLRYIAWFWQAAVNALQGKRLQLQAAALQAWRQQASAHLQLTRSLSLLTLQPAS